MELFRSVDAPIRIGLTWEERWAQEDRGLIACWERGREVALENKDLAERARRGELVVLPWKGGVEKKLQGNKVGTYRYLAMWQGLREEDLNLDSDCEVSMTCSVKGVTVVYTDNYSKYSVA